MFARVVPSLGISRYGDDKVLAKVLGVVFRKEGFVEQDKGTLKIRSR